MPKIAYAEIRFHGATMEVIEAADRIIGEYLAEGYTLTLRQLFYQFVARGLLANTEKSYTRLGSIISRARLAGLIDWEAITDRTRESRGNSHFESPAEILDVAARGYRIDLRADQEVYLEAWIEKDALLGVLERVCGRLDVPFLSCRGYVSASALWEAAQRLIEQENAGRETVILHLGDHDPSGLDMTRDIQERLDTFGSIAEVRRIALNMEQVRRYAPPPNPAKESDTRWATYTERYGDESWELDSLDPRTIAALIETAVGEYTDDDRIAALIERQETERQQLLKLAESLT